MFIEGTDVTGVGLLDFITGDLTPARAVISTFTYLHCMELVIYFWCFYIIRYLSP
jgi:hypothetical protein